MTKDEKDTQAREPEPKLIPDDQTPILPEGYIPLEETPTPLLSAKDDRWIIRAYCKTEATEGMLIFEDEREIVFLCADECPVMLDCMLAQFVDLYPLMSQQVRLAPRNREMFARLGAAHWAYYERKHGMPSGQIAMVKIPAPEPGIEGLCDKCGKDVQIFQMFQAGKATWLCGDCLSQLRQGGRHD